MQFPNEQLAPINHKSMTNTIEKTSSARPNEFMQTSSPPTKPVSPKSFVKDINFEPLNQAMQTRNHDKVANTAR